MEKNRLNAVIITHHYPPHISGVGMVAQNHANRLAALGHEVTVITSDTAKTEKSYRASGVEVVRIKALNFSEAWSAPFPIFSLRLIGALFAYIPKADVVHIHDAFYMSSFFAALVAWLYRKPIVLTQHVAMIAHPNILIVFIERLVYATSGQLIFNLSREILVYNGRVMEFLERRAAREKIRFLPNGVDPELFYPAKAGEKEALKRELGLDPAKKTILFVGRLVPKKGFDKVLAARSAEYQIACAGADAPAEKYDNVVFLGKLNQETLARAYRAADIFVLPSESEGFPLSVQEAMSSGLPVITTNESGYDAYELDRKMLYLIDNPTAESVKRAIEELLANPERLHAMAAYGEKYARERFSWPLVIENLLAAYRRAITPPQKIAFVSDSLLPYFNGGKERRLYEISRRLVAENREVHIYTMKWWQGPNTIVNEGVYFHAICKLHPLYKGERRSISEALFFGIATMRLMFVPFDIMDVDHMPFFPLFGARIVTWLRGKKMYATWHEVWGKEYWSEYIQGPAALFGWYTEWLSFKLPDVIIAVSEHTAKRLRAMGVRADIKTVSLGVDLKSVYSAAQAPAASDVIYVGRMLGHKGVDLLVRAIHIVKATYPHIKLIIVGSGPEEASIKTLIAKLGVQENIQIISKVEGSNGLYGLMKASKMLVLPSIREGFGLVVIEANAAGIPVITTRHKDNAARDLVHEGINGLLADPAAEDIAVKIREILQKGASMKPRHDIDKYDWPMVVESLERAFA